MARTTRSSRASGSVVEGSGSRPTSWTGLGTPIATVTGDRKRSTPATSLATACARSRAKRGSPRVLTSTAAAWAGSSASRSADRPASGSSGLGERAWSRVAVNREGVERHHARGAQVEVAFDLDMGQGSEVDLLYEGRGCRLEQEAGERARRPAHDRLATSSARSIRRPSRSSCTEDHDRWLGAPVEEALELAAAYPSQLLRVDA